MQLTLQFINEREHCICWVFIRCVFWKLFPSPGIYQQKKLSTLRILRQLYICAPHRGNLEVQRGKTTTAGEILGTSLHGPCVLMQVPVVFRNQDGYCLTHHLEHAPSCSWISTWGKVFLENGIAQRTATNCSCWESPFQALSNTRRGDAATFKTRNYFGDPI